MKALASSLALIALLVAKDAPADKVAPPTLAAPASPTQNAAALRKLFSIADTTTARIPAGTYVLPCGTSLSAAGSLSLVGAGAGRTVLRLEHACLFDRPLMAWESRSNVQLSGLTIDLNGSRSRTLQNIVQFKAYDANASGLDVNHIEILNGNTLSLQLVVAAAGGFDYSGVSIDHNRFEMTPGKTQNQCIALTTVNGIGGIPGARITNNVCRGSAIQADGEGTLIAGNDVGNYQFGAGIFTAPVAKKTIVAAEWAGGTATLRYQHSPYAFTAGETVHVFDATPAAYNGTFRVIRVTPSSVSVEMPRNPGRYLRGALVATDPTNRDCVIRDNRIHDTPQTLDVNGSAPGGIENNCVNSRLENNRITDVSGAGVGNFANGARYVRNFVSGAGFRGKGSAGGESDGAAFVAFDNGSGLPWYRSTGLHYEGNVTETRNGLPRFGYYEEPYHLFSTTFGNNSFRAADRATVVRSESCRAAPVRC